MVYFQIAQGHAYLLQTNPICVAYPGCQANWEAMHWHTLPMSGHRLPRLVGGTTAPLMYLRQRHMAAGRCFWGSRLVSLAIGQQR